MDQDYYFCLHLIVLKSIKTICRFWVLWFNAKYCILGVQYLTKIVNDQIVEIWLLILMEFFCETATLSNVKVDQIKQEIFDIFELRAVADRPRIDDKMLIC